MQGGNVPAALPGEVGVDEAGKDGVDLNAVHRPGRGQRLGELYNPSLAGSVDRAERRSKDGQHRADVDDLAPAGALHGWVSRPGAEKGSGKVDLQHLGPLGQGQFLGSFADVHAGVVDQNVQPTEVVHGGLHQGFDRRLVTDVHADRQRLSPFLLNFLDHLPGFFLVSGRHDHCRPRFGETPDDPQADASIASGNYGDCSTQVKRRHCHGSGISRGERVPKSKPICFQPPDRKRGPGPSALQRPGAGADRGCAGRYHSAKRLVKGKHSQSGVPGRGRPP